MKTVAILNAKGGVGKSTICTQLAVRAAENFERVALIDLDPSGGARLWFKERAENKMGGMPELFVGVSDPADAIDRLDRDGWDIAFLDGSPGTIDATRLVAGLVDLVVIPERCSTDDLSQAAAVARLCQNAGKSAIGVVNEMPLKSDRQTYQREMAVKIEASIRAYGLPVVSIANRDQFLRAKNAGIGVHEMSGRVAEARKEIDKLYALVIEQLYGEELPS